MTHIQKTVNDFDPGLTKREFYLSSNTDSEYHAFVAMAVRDNVIVWLADPEESQITKEMCDSIADNFEAIYPYETELFGDISEEVFIDNDFKTDDIVNYTDLAHFTNILVYDFSKFPALDGSVGYFSYSDYNAATKSNIGNYLYLDEKDILMKDFGNNEAGVSYDAFNTVAHEYMHSLQFARKIIDQKQYDEQTALGEMLGQLCEHVLYRQMGIPNMSSVISIRYSSFFSEYFTSGILDYNGFDSASYPVLVSFGIFLLHNYGGQKLFGEILKNKYSNWDAIINGIYAVNNEKVTKSELLLRYMEAYVCKGSEYSEKMKTPLRITAQGK